SPRAVRFVKRYPAKLRSVNARDAVMLRQPLVEKGIVRVEQIENTAILAEYALKKQFCFAAKGLTQTLVKIGKRIRVWSDGLQVSKLKPLAAEIADESLRARIVQHAARLQFQHRRVFQLSLFRNIQQLVVRDAAPKKERKPRGEFEIVQTVR